MEEEILAYNFQIFAFIQIYVLWLLQWFWGNVGARLWEKKEIW